MSMIPGIPDDQVPTDPLMAFAWRECLLWAVSDEELVAAFRAATGNAYRPPRNNLEAMVDAATGNTFERFVAEFVPWFNANVWGDLTLQAGRSG